MNWGGAAQIAGLPTAVLLATEGFQYDANGNRMTSVTFRTSGGAMTKKVEYVHDAFDRRMMKMADADGNNNFERYGAWVWDGDHPIVQLSDSDGLLSFQVLTHHRIKPHCPEENGVMERANRTLREKLDEQEVTSGEEAEKVLESIIDHYNNKRLHSSLGYKPPANFYRGNPESADEQRALKLRQARHKRRHTNLELKPKTLPLEAEKRIA